MTIKAPSWNCLCHATTLLATSFILGANVVGEDDDRRLKPPTLCRIWSLVPLANHQLSDPTHFYWLLRLVQADQHKADERFH